MASIPLALGLIIASTAVLWFGSRRLERASEQIGEVHGLPEVVQGSVVIAIGSSFPELATALLAAILHDAFQLGLGVIIGSAIFNVLVIPAISVLATDRMETNRDLVFKEGLSYLVAVLGLVLLLALGAVYNPIAGVDATGLMTRPLALVPLGLYAFYLLLQWIDASEHEAETNSELSPWTVWGGLIAGLALVLVSAEGLIRGVLAIGGTVGISELAWGMTVIAVATSLPDAFASLSAAREGRSLASLANALGSNTFDLLVVVPIGILIAGTERVDLATTGPLMLILAAATVLLIAFMRTGLVLTRREGGVLLASYGAFLVVLLHAEGLIAVV